MSIFCLSPYLSSTVNAPQGDPAELAKAQALVDEATKALDEVLEKLEEQKVLAAKLAEAEKAAKVAQAEAEKAVEEQKVRIISMWRVLRCG